MSDETANTHHAMDDIVPGSAEDFFDDETEDVSLATDYTGLVVRPPRNQAERDALGDVAPLWPAYVDQKPV